MRVLAALAVLLLVPAFVMAQVPGVPSPTTAKVTVSAGAPLGVVPLGKTATTPITVELKVANLFCPQPVNGKLTLKLVDLPSALDGLTGTLDRTEIPFSFAGGATLSPTVSGVANLTVELTTGVTPSHEHSFNLTASFEPTALTGTCIGVTPTGPTPPSAKGYLNVGMTTGPALVQANTTTGPDGSATTTTSTTKAKSSAAPLMPILALVVLGVAALGRKQ